VEARALQAEFDGLSAFVVVQWPALPQESSPNVMRSCPDTNWALRT
jgi:hypothetical protein